MDKKIFERYAQYSVKVDRYYHCINAYANNHHGFKYIHDTLDGVYKRMREIESISGDIDIEIKNFLFHSYLMMQQVHITNLFSDNDPCNLGDLASDMRMYSYISCYCYQWNLFESLVSYVVEEMKNSNKLEKGIVNKLKNSKYQTKKMLDILNTEVFDGSELFEFIMPWYDKDGEFEKVDSSDLHLIRKNRNEYVHNILRHNIKNEDIIEKQRKYDTDMWILRKCAEKVFFSADKLGI